MALLEDREHGGAGGALAPDRVEHGTAGAAAGPHDEDGDPTSPTAQKKKHRDNMILIGVAIVGVVLTYLIYRSRSSSSSQSGTYTTPAGATGTVAGGAGTDPYTQQALGQLVNQETANGQANQQAFAGLTSLLQSLTSEVGQMQASPTPAPAPAAPVAPANPYAGEVQQGSGFWNPSNAYAPIPGIGGGQFVNLPSGGGSQSGAAGYSGQEYFQPAPGVFTAWTSPTQVGPGTPIFAKTG